jgi:hypothetical protein
MCNIMLRTALRARGPYIIKRRERRIANVDVANIVISLWGIFSSLHIAESHVFYCDIELQND